MSAVVEIGDRIRELREARGLTVAQLAREMGVGERTVSRWQIGDGPRPATLRRLAEVLDVPLVELIGREGSTLEERLAALESRVDELLERLDHVEDRLQRRL